MEERTLDAHLLAEAHGYVAGALYPGEWERRQRTRAVEAMGYAVGEMVLSPAERARWLPRTTATDSRLRVIQRRYRRGLLAAHMAVCKALERWPDGTLHKVASYAGGLMPRQWRSAAAPRGFDVVRRVWRPHLPTVHLVIPLLLARVPFKQELACRNPDLVALAVPDNFADLITDHRWPRQALQVAAMWRWHLRAGSN